MTMADRQTPTGAGQWMRAAMAAALMAAAAGGAAAQGQFAPRVLVNDSAVTGYEVAQRVALLRALRTPGDLEEQAVDQLIEDRLRRAQARAAGIAATDEQIEEAMTEFAGRADQDLDAFLAMLAEEGVARQTFRDFVHAGLVWREVVRARFGPRAQVSDAEVDRALALTSQRGAVEVRVAEIILPATEEFIDRANDIARQVQDITSFDEFSAAARQVSVAPSRENGGVLDPLDLSNLPQPIASQLLTLSPGQVTEPIPVPDALLLFQLRGLRELARPEATSVSVEYAQFFLPTDDPGAGARVRARVDTCDDLYGVARDLPEERLRVDTLPVGQVPEDIAVALAQLDETEAVVMDRGGARVFLMLCGRTLELEEAPTRGQIRQQLVNQRLNSFADGLLAQLRADAFIREP